MRHTLQRGILGALVVIVAATSVTGSVQGAPDDGARKTTDYADADTFKMTCEVNEGDFYIDSGGNTNCDWPGGQWTQCDANGKDCWTTPPPKKLEPIDVSVPAAGEIATPDEGSGEAPPPAVDSPTSAQPSLVAAADDQEQDHGKRKGKHGKKGKKSGKGRK